MGLWWASDGIPAWWYTYPSEKYVCSSLGKMIIPNMWKNGPKHQPGITNRLVTQNLVDFIGSEHFGVQTRFTILDDFGKGMKLGFTPYDFLGSHNPRRLRIPSERSRLVM